MGHIHSIGADSKGFAQLVIADLLGSGERLRCLWESGC